MRNFRIKRPNVFHCFFSMFIWLILIPGCTSKKPISENIVNEVIEVDSTLAFRCKLLEFPTISNQTLLHDIYSIMSVNKEYWVFTDYSKNGLLKAINNHKLKLEKDEDRKNIVESYNKEYGITNYVSEYGMLDDIALNLFSMNENVITIEYTFSGGRGGVGWETKEFITFDKNTEQVIKIYDILKDNTNASELNSILRKYAITQNNCLQAEPIPISEIFYFNKESITFVYDKYKIACGADGVINITLPLSEIRSYLKDEFYEKYLQK
jgi:hypothetical protein